MYYRAAASVAIPFGPEAANSQAVEPTLVGLVIDLETIAAPHGQTGMLDVTTR
jgi:hypothetical protein